MRVVGAVRVPRRAGEAVDWVFRAAAAVTEASSFFEDGAGGGGTVVVKFTQYLPLVRDDREARFRGRRRYGRQRHAVIIIIIRRRLIVVVRRRGGLPP